MTNRQIAGAASGTHEHDIENTTLSVTKDYLYSFKQIQELSGVVWCLTKAAAKEHKKTVHRVQTDSSLVQAKIRREMLQWN